MYWKFFNNSGYLIRVYRLDGSRVRRVEEFENNGSYVVASRTERFIPLNYVNTAPLFQSAVRPNYIEY